MKRQYIITIKILLKGSCVCLLRSCKSSHGSTHTSQQSDERDYYIIHCMETTSQNTYGKRFHHTVRCRPSDAISSKFTTKDARTGDYNVLMGMFTRFSAVHLCAENPQCKTVAAKWMRFKKSAEKIHPNVHKLTWSADFKPPACQFMSSKRCWFVGDNRPPFHMQWDPRLLADLPRGHIMKEVSSLREPLRVWKAILIVNGHVVGQKTLLSTQMYINWPDVQISTACQFMSGKRCWFVADNPYWILWERQYPKENLSVADFTVDYPNIHSKIPNHRRRKKPLYSPILALPWQCISCPPIFPVHRPPFHIQWDCCRNRQRSHRVFPQLYWGWLPLDPISFKSNIFNLFRQSNFLPLLLPWN